MKNQTNTRFLTQSGAIAAVYVLLTMLAAALGLDSGAVQLRLSEALTILPVFTPAAVPGLFIGCLLSNLLAGGVIWDVIFGSLATLLGAIGTRLLRKKRWLACLPPILANVLIIPFVLTYAYGIPGGIPWFMFTVGMGEVLSCGLLGQLLWSTLDKHKGQLFK
ncbi:MAG: QueT transporter family protein [Clostridia bacterium]|nr:QueT transporter family protein [Clostridia bacterium]MBP3588216.1 QueT transporter family protein [Clostridia bacterium]